MNTTIDELARDKDERDFLEMVNVGGLHYDSVEEFIEEHDCTASEMDGCSDCWLLMQYGFIPDFYPDIEFDTEGGD